jgi:hypothetical protein
MCGDAGLRGQKATRANENFAWNVRLLKSQLDAMQRTRAEANTIMTQVGVCARVQTHRCECRSATRAVR